VTDRPHDDVAREQPACYLHPKRAALLRCSRCEQPICSDDAIEAPVGWQCPKCAEGGRPVQRLAQAARHAPITRGLVYTIGALFLIGQVAELGLIDRFALRPILVSAEGVRLVGSQLPGGAEGLAASIGEPWLLVTSAFLHANLMHVGFNGFLLWQLGHMLEPTLGRARYVALYAAGMGGGSLGVVGLSWLAAVTGWADGPLGTVLGGHPAQPTIGASGAVFGLMGAAMVGMRNRGVNPWRTSIGTLVLLNLVLTFVVPNISVGGHLGGLLGGAAAAKLLFVERERAAGAARRAGLLAAGTFALAIVLATLLPNALLGGG
jgi:membrane associated rhomboid family serine protease